ncbi:unnamed protein product [Discosporangium mesarthrocarpum]
MKIITVPVYSDNYAYLLIDEHAQEAAVVDPVEPEKVMASAAREGVRISKVLTTHKHWDHSGGNKEMTKRVQGLEVVGGSEESVPACTTFVRDGDTLTVGSSISVRCIHTPGHTQGHMCYFAVDGEEKAVFTGDILFIGGAGKFFEGTAEDVHHSLYDKLGKLPLETLVYCGHEYTLANYRFALSVEPDNADLVKENQWAVEQISKALPTVPSMMAKEFATNPFMRVNQASVQAKTRLGAGATPTQYLARIREMKNNFWG